jgi:DNA-binding LacI/PurR family transcriptional regulator
VRAPCRVGVDDRGGTRSAARHLLELGHRRLAVAALPKHRTDEGRRSAEGRDDMWSERLTGVREAVEAAGLSWDSVPVVTAPVEGIRREGGRDVGRRLLDRPDPPTGVVSMSDELAAGVLDAAAERGVPVPGQLSVVGFDDTPTAASTTPRLTTVRQPLVAKGEEVARLVLAGAPEQDLVLPTELIVRGSTGPVP